jgi:hypothetical protein
LLGPIFLFLKLRDRRLLRSFIGCLESRCFFIELVVNFLSGLLERDYILFVLNTNKSFFKPLSVLVKFMLSLSIVRLFSTKC